MELKRMENLAAFNAREVKIAEAEERERDEYFSAGGQRDLSKRQSHPNKLFKT